MEQMLTHRTFFFAALLNLKDCFILKPGTEIRLSLYIKMSCLIRKHLTSLD